MVWVVHEKFLPSPTMHRLFKTSLWFFLFLLGGKGKVVSKLLTIDIIAPLWLNNQITTFGLLECPKMYNWKCNTCFKLVGMPLSIHLLFQTDIYAQFFYLFENVILLNPFNRMKSLQIFLAQNLKLTVNLFPPWTSNKIKDSLKDTPLDSRPTVLRNQKGKIRCPFKISSIWHLMRNISPWAEGL